MSDIAVITGAAGDIGHAIVLRFLQNGFRVIATDIDLDGLNERASGLDDTSNYIPLTMDITERASVTQAFETIAKKHGVVAVLINNAGNISAHSLKTTTEELWLGDIELNLNGAWRCMNAVTPGMVDAGEGVIINIASVNGLGIYGHPGYSVAKAGLIHLTKFAAVEFGRHGIRCNAVCPGTVKTRVWIERQKTNPQIIEDALKWYPSRRASVPDDIAKTVQFAAIDAPKTLNGAIIEVDGGLVAGQDIVASAFSNDDL